MLIKHLSQTIGPLKRPAAVLPFSRLNTAGFKTKKPIAPEETPVAATLDDVQHGKNGGDTHRGDTQRGEQTQSTPYAQSERASSDTIDSDISGMDRPPNSVTHTVHTEDGEYHSTTETPTMVSWTRISYLGSPSASEEMVHADKFPFDPLKAIREMHDWRGLGSSQSKVKQ